jgi:tRNA A-37 threonylcarbamoyl transferase component Bud32
MRHIGRDELTQLIARNKILYGTVERPGIMLTPNGEIVKAFYKRKKLSTATFFPQARQFITSSQKLSDRGITAPTIKDFLYCKEIPVHLVIYDRLEGEDIRSLCETEGIKVLARLPAYLANLHKIGVYFRAIHLGNILIEGKTTSLIDISDLSISLTALGVFQRARNLAHLFNAEEDKRSFVNYGIDRFLDEYIIASQLTSVPRWAFRQRLKAALDKDMALSLRTKRQQLS